MQLRWVAWLILMLLAGCAAQPTDTGAQDSTATAATAASGAAGEKPSELICTREKVAGSIMTRNVCRTRRQAERDEAAAADLLRRQAEARAGRGSGYE